MKELIGIIYFIGLFLVLVGGAVVNYKMLEPGNRLRDLFDTGEWGPFVLISMAWPMALIGWLLIGIFELLGRIRIK